MAEDESYEIMPYKEIVALKKEMELLKKNSGDVSSKELINQMASLTKSMSSMLGLFKQAADEMKAEESTEDKLAGKIDPLLDKLDVVIDQNKTIAEGMVAVADMIKDMGSRKPMRRPLQHDLGPEHDFGKEMPPMTLPHDNLSEMPPAGPPPSFGMPPPGLGPMPQMHNDLPPMGPPPQMPDFGAPSPLPPMPNSMPKEKPKKGLFGFGKK